jgi:hypothetical protein
MGRVGSENLNLEELSPNRVSFKKKVMVKKYKTNSTIRKSLRKVNVDEPEESEQVQNHIPSRQRKSNQI